MAEEKRSAFARIELVIIGVIMIIFLIWASRKCSRTQADFQAEYQAAAADSLSDTLAVPEAQPKPRPQPTPGLQADTLRRGNLEVIRERVVPLYVTIEGLNMRQGPGLDYPIVDRIELFEQVYFLGEITDSLYEINLGKITPREPWVKVRSPKGKTGWVFGAGVSYYKKKLEGVE
jgi:uncharacterized protein YgiM (DUF1202 family)